MNTKLLAVLASVALAGCDSIPDPEIEIGSCFELVPEDHFFTE